MYKIFCLFAFTFITTAVSFSQNYNWITPNKLYLKMSVAEDGIYRIARTDFTNAGVNTQSIDPRTVKLLNRGVQIPVYFQGESDGIFDTNDYFDFYGTRNYGGPTMTYTEYNVVAYITNEYYNLYSDTNSYWVEWGGTNGLRMANSSYNSPALYPLNYYYDLIHLEKDKIFWLGETLNGNDFRSFSNERFKGETWYWSLLNNGQSTTEIFSTPLLYNTPQTASVRIFAYPVYMSPTIQNENTIQIRINNNVVGTITVNDVVKIDTVLTFSSSLLSSISQNTATATYIANGGFNGLMFFDLFEISYPKVFKFQGNQSLLLLSGTDTTSRQFKISGYVSANPTSIYDIVNGIKINSFTSNADTLKFSGKGNSKFEVINKTITKKPLRIIQRQVPDYVSGTNGADYLLIYNTLFSAQASQLKSYREAKDEFRVMNAEIQNIYDIFNYGNPDPVAVRNFIRHVYNNWTAPKVKYVCLLGRGSLDPKKNSVSTNFEKDLVPTSGNPSSDNYLVNVNTGGFTYYPHISIGRLPAYTTNEAQSMVNNIITYESQPTSSWVKSLTFIAGGIDATEQTLLKALNDSLIIPYALPPPLSGNPVKIMRDDLGGGLTFNYPDSIKNQINRGTLTVNFMGHAGSQDWELGMTDPNVLSNFNGIFPLVFSITCYTGKIADSYSRTFGEKFMNMNNKGSIGFIGTSGWGYVGAGSDLNENMFSAISKDTIRRIGDIFANSIYKMKKDSNQLNILHTINCYTLQGDPALSLLLPKIPEYSISNSDYKISTASPFVGETVTLTAYPKNFGLFSDSCSIRLQILTGESKYLTKDTVIKNFRFADSVKFNFKVAQSGMYTLNLLLDHLNLNPKENRSDNSISIGINTKNISFLPFKPINNEVIKSDSVQLSGLNPMVIKSLNTVVLLMELDTTKRFDSPIKKTFVSSNQKGVITKFGTVLPVLDTNILYYWRTNSIINSDTTGWSPNQIFRYNPVITEKSESIGPDTNTLVYKNRSDQFNAEDYSNTYFNNGIRLSEFPGILSLRSYGSNGSEASFFNVLDKSIHIDGGGNTGLNLLKVRKSNGRIVQHKNIKMTFANSSDTVVSFLNTFDSTHYLMGLNAAYIAGGFPFSSAAKLKFQQFGSTKIDSFVAGFFDSWAFIGYQNAPLVNVYEEVHRYNGAWTQSLGSMTKTFKKTDGTVSNIIGPANSWKDFSWQNQIFNGSSVKFDVYGIDKNNLSTLLFSNITTNNLVNISSVDAYRYPKLNLVSKLNMDTLTGLQSPVFTALKANYTDPAEIVADVNSFIQSDSILTFGKEFKLKFKYYNVGNLSVPGVIVNIYKISVTPSNLIKTDTLNRELKQDSGLSYSEKFPAPYIRMFNGKAQLIVEVLPKGRNNEVHTFNNYHILDLIINGVNSDSKVEIFSDGHLLQNGDYVSSKPEIKINIKSSDNKYIATDTSRVLLVLNNKRVPHFANENSSVRLRGNIEKKLPANPDKAFMFFPELTSGENRLRIVYKNENDSYDSTDYTVFVSDELQIKDFYNYPNPMRNETSFVFNLAGLETPQSCKIKIYTVSGRLIKEINYLPVIGYNSIPWDGRDNDGDKVANGTYLYKFVTEDNSKTETAIQKLVILN